MTNKPAHRRRRYKREPMHYPSLSEMRGGARWSVYKEILALYDVNEFQKSIWDEVRKRCADTGVADAERIRAAGPQAALGAALLTYLGVFGEGREALDVCDEMIKELRILRGYLTSEAQRRHMVIDLLLEAGATWPEVAAMLRADEWDGWKDYEREGVTDEIKENHRNYKKNEAAQQTPGNTLK